MAPLFEFSPLLSTLVADCCVDPADFIIPQRFSLLFYSQVATTVIIRPTLIASVGISPHMILTPPIDLHVLWPIRVGLPAFFKWIFLYRPIYFFIIRTYSINIKKIKRVLKQSHGFFFYFHIEILGPGVDYSLRETNTRELGLLNAAYSLLLPA